MIHVLPRITALLGICSLFAVTFGGWYFTLSFDPTSFEWWKWLFDYFIQTNSLPKEIIIPAALGVIVMIVIMIAGRLVLERARNLTESGDQESQSIHGSAHFAELEDIEKAGLLRGRGVVVGGLPDRLKGTTMLRHDGPEHVLAFAPTRSGKGISVVIPTLLTWPGSTIVLDIKGENYARTSGWRASLGQNVFCFAPGAQTGSARYNPLNEVRLGTDHQIADCMHIARMIIDTSGTGMKDFWEQEGFSWLATAILHVLCRVRNEENGRVATLADVFYFLSVGDEEDGDDPEEQLDKLVKKSPRTKEDDEEGYNRLMNDMVRYDHGDEQVNREVKRGAARMRKRAGNERSGVLSTASSQLTIFAETILARNTSTCDFTIDDLMNAEQPTNLYLAVTPAEIILMKPLIRILLNQFLSRLTAKMSYDENVTLYKHRLLLMLDEFPQLGKLDIFESSLAFMAGYGVKAFLITQDITQLQAAYTRNESIISNCHVRIAYAPNKIETARVLSDMTGKTTVVQRKRSISKNLDKGGANISESVSEVARPLMTPDECMMMPGLEYDENDRVTGPGKMLVFTAGNPPIYGQQFIYFLDEELNARSKMKPSGNIYQGKPVVHGDPKPPAASNENKPAPSQEAKSEVQAQALPEPESNPLVERFMKAADSQSI